MADAIPTGNQRWELGRATYRPPAECIHTADYEVAPIPEADARAFVLDHHYSATFPAQRYSFGLHRHGALVGAAVFSQPCNNKGVTNAFPGLTHLEGAELGRFVLLDEVPGNGETWFLARCFAQLRECAAPRRWADDRPWRGVRGVVSYSDPTPRQSLGGEVVFPGHLGTIYQASNGMYLGRGTARTLRLIDAPDGRVLTFSDRAAQKVRAKSQGWQYSTRQLLAAGAPPLPADDPTPSQLQEWLRLARAQVTRPLRHRGNHRYAWIINRKHDRRLLADVREGAGAYPKVRDAA